jgi:quercetin dioxygenase-like cupin family protein
MEVTTTQQSVKGPAQMFTGDVWFDVIAKGDEPSRLRANAVHFAPCARTAWHSHALGQTLYVTEGVGYVQSRGGERSSRSTRATSSSPRPAKSTGTAPPLAIS